jgi:hypothetical protein
LPDGVAAVEAGAIGFAHFSLLASVARGCTAKPSGSDIAATSGDGTDPDDPATPDEARTDPGDPGEPGAPGDGATDPATPANPSAFDERPLLELAREHSVGLFAKDCDRARHAYDAAAVLNEHLAATERNRCDFIPCEGGFLAIRGCFDPIAAATIKTAVLPLAKPTGFADHRPMQRRLADALVEVASHALNLGVIPTTGGPSTHLQLTASVETVMGLDGTSGGELEFAGAAPAATVQRLACDARIRRVLLGPNSAVIDVGRALRLPSPAARAALRVRSGGCDWPRCERPVAFTNAHHLVHWGHGGPTDIDNLVLLCYRHHWLVHEGGWQLARVEDGRMLAIPPTPTHRTWIRAPATGVGGSGQQVLPCASRFEATPCHCGVRREEPVALLRPNVRRPCNAAIDFVATRGGTATDFVATRHDAATDCVATRSDTAAEREAVGRPWRISMPFASCNCFL